jgi:hypothetical protein
MGRLCRLSSCDEDVCRRLRLGGHRREETCAESHQSAQYGGITPHHDAISSRLRIGNGSPGSQDPQLRIGGSGHGHSWLDCLHPTRLLSTLGPHVTATPARLGSRRPAPALAGLPFFVEHLPHDPAYCAGGSAPRGVRPGSAGGSFGLRGASLPTLVHLPVQPSHIMQKCWLHCVSPG